MTGRENAPRGSPPLTWKHKNQCQAILYLLAYYIFHIFFSSPTYHLMVDQFGTMEILLQLKGLCRTKRITMGISYNSSHNQVHVRLS